MAPFAEWCWLLVNQLAKALARCALRASDSGETLGVEETERVGERERV